MSERKFVFILTVIVSISGLSQGMLLPLIAYIFEQNNVPSHVNGLHATSLYIGVFVASFFLEGLLRKWGYKRLILLGGILVTLSLLLFPIMKAMSIWFLLRMLVGVGDDMLHFSTQSWLTQVIPQHKIGKTLAVYGLSFSLGFMIGPLLARLVQIHESVPFIVSSLLTLVVSLLVLRLKTSYPPTDQHIVTFRSTFTNFKNVIHISWVAFLFPATYGFLESSLNSNFPVFALKHQLTLNDITWILPAFSLGSILFLIPLGSLSDQVNRNKLLMTLTILGGTTFLLADWFVSNTIVMIVLFLIAGIFIGSLYSLGVGYMTEITPVKLLPAGNLMCGIAFSLGSMLGPVLGGIIIHISNNTVFFTMISFVVFLVAFATYYYGRLNKYSKYM